MGVEEFGYDRGRGREGQTRTNNPRLYLKPHEDIKNTV